MAIISTFGAGLLTTFGDSAGNALTIGRNAAGTIAVNGGAMAVRGGPATIANTARINAFGLGGDDVITIDETNGAIPQAFLFGGEGRDTLTGGSGNDQLFGGAGDDALFGKGGADMLFGGAGNDVLTGGDGNDFLFGEAGDDRLIWNPGDDDDLFEGGAGTDTAEINGGNGAEHFTITANGSRFRLDRTDPAPFHIDGGTIEHIALNTNGGDDVISVSGNMAAIASITIDSGAGNDTISGGNGADTLIGGDGNDVIDGNQGNDLALLGAGDDLFVWDPGDGSDTVEGQGGFDTLQFNGANVNERIELSATGGRATLTRDVANITMDTNGVERVVIAAKGGADTLTIRDMTGTAVQEVMINLEGSAGGGDAAADSVAVRGTQGADFIDVLGSGASAAVLGLTALVQVTGLEASDALIVQALGGNDTINAGGLSTALTLQLDGGAGDDVLTGSTNADILLGGDGDDFVLGGRGNDTALLGTGDDIFVWNPGDGSDVVEGQAGHDVLLFNGAALNENFEIAANGSRVRLSRDVAAVTMDVNGVERVEINAERGSDNVTIGDLTGTDLHEIAINMGAVPGAPQTDGAADRVTVFGTAGNDTISVTGAAGALTVNGLAAQISLTRIEAGLDTLTVEGGGGNDTIDASHLAAGTVGLVLHGGQGADVIIGSAGADLVLGQSGNDTALLGAGDDTFVWNPGDGSDVIEGQAGFDTLVFNGANVNENIAISANGGRALLTRDVANISMDMNDMEALHLQTFGGADNVVVNNLFGTDVQRVEIDLAGSNGAPDGAADTVTINATQGDDVIVVTRQGSTVTVSGLEMDVFIFNFDATDRLVINGLGGDDVIEASGLSLGSIGFTADGGDGDDVLIGGDGADILLGGFGDDVLIGGLGLDILNGGTGDNILIQ